MQLPTLVFWAGWAQLVIVVGSLSIPHVLKWSDDVAQLRPLTRQVFWTYAAYIWSTNLFFGIISVMMPNELVGGSALALALSIFIAIYWGARIGIQFFYFDRRDAPTGLPFQLAEWLLVGIFVALTLIYSYVVWINWDILSLAL